MWATGHSISLTAERAAEFEFERARARLLDRPADPEVMIEGAEQRLAAVLAVEQHAVAGPARRDLGGGLDREQFEGADALARRAGVVGDLLQLRAMIDRQRHDRGRLRPAGRRPVDVIERLVAAQRPMGRAALEEAAELGPGRIFGRAQETRDGESAVGVGVGAAGLERLVAQPAAQEAGHEGVAGAEHVIDLDRKARPLDSLVERIRGWRREIRRSPSGRA